MEQQPDNRDGDRKTMETLARVIDKTFNGELRGKNRKWGFALLVFPFEAAPGYFCDYVSNAERDDMVKAMKEFIEQAEAERGNAA